MDTVISSCRVSAGENATACERRGNFLDAAVFGVKHMATPGRRQCLMPQGLNHLFRSDVAAGISCWRRQTDPVTRPPLPPSRLLLLRNEGHPSAWEDSDGAVALVTDKSAPDHLALKTFPADAQVVKTSPRYSSGRSRSRLG